MPEHPCAFGYPGFGDDRETIRRRAPLHSQGGAWRIRSEPRLIGSRRSGWCIPPAGP
ncbi:hypothetical protein HMPREF9005_1134 [Actinomyces sp. oral taxon 178 str. F0338]|nr:hypothetical protein HMPREF9005_1134 [Actinomyces sp. oral taxon 178 str. F0338]